jgi:hypothetical protein
MSKAPNSPKHPRDMTTQEAVKHLFHPDVPGVVERLKTQKDAVKKPSLKK